MEDITSSTKTKGPYMTIIIISLGALISACVTLAIAHILFVKFCKTRPQLGPTLHIQPSSMGLNRRILNMIPILFYSTKTCNLYRISQGDQCVICLNRFKKGDLIRCLPICGHIFHVSCIDDWFHAHSTCPVCRSFVGLIASVSDNNHCRCSNVSAIKDGHGCITRTRSDYSLRHCDKMVLPIEGLSPREFVSTGVTRSLSMDHFSVVIDPREQTDLSCPSSSSSSSSSSSCDDSPPMSKIDFVLSRLNQAPPTRCVQCVSNMAPRQVHELGQGGSGLRNDGILQN